jgi:hypothetical protein
MIGRMHRTKGRRVKARARTGAARALVAINTVWIALQFAGSLCRSVGSGTVGHTCAGETERSLS